MQNQLSCQPYPEVRTEDVWDELAGIRSFDPYRWLEDGSSQEVRALQRAQNELASSYVRSWAGFSRLRELVATYSTARFGTVPRRAGGLWFRSAIEAGATQHGVVVAESPSDQGRMLYKPAQDLAPAPYLSWFSPSPDGSLLALGLCTDGSEQNTIRLVEVATGAQLTAPSERLMDNWSGGVTWLPDSSGFWFTAIEGDAVDLDQRVLFFDVVRGSTQQVPTPFGERADYQMLQLSVDGRRLIAYEGLTAPRPVAVAHISDPIRPDWRPFITETGAVVHGHLLGDTYYAVTDLDAPRGRLVAYARPTRPTRLDHPAPGVRRCAAKRRTGGSLVVRHRADRHLQPRACPGRHRPRTPGITDARSRDHRRATVPVHEPGSPR